jgi:hypothetical protein
VILSGACAVFTASGKRKLFPNIAVRHYCVRQVRTSQVCAIQVCASQVCVRLDLVAVYLHNDNLTHLDND